FCLHFLRSLPCSPLFPYTTLFRSVLGRVVVQIIRTLVARIDGRLWHVVRDALTHQVDPARWNDVAREWIANLRPGGRIGSRRERDRKSTRLNSSHLGISYAVFWLK